MKQIATMLIRAYQMTISPIMSKSCRFTPSCSNYAIGAISRHGVIKGGLMATRRVLGCHPFSAGGYDPVK